MTNTIKEKIAIGELNKSQGNELFKSNDLNGALLRYHTAILYLQGLDNSQFSAFNPGSDMDGETVQHVDKLQIVSLLTSVHANMAAVYLKQQVPEKAIRSSKSALQLSPSHAKSMFRIGAAYKMQYKWDKAAEMMVAAAKLAPNDVGIRMELDAVKALLKQKELESKEEMRKGLSFTKIK